MLGFKGLKIASMAGPSPRSATAGLKVFFLSRGKWDSYYHGWQVVTGADLG